MNKKTKGILGYLIGALITIVGFIPFWGSCMDYCNKSGSINPGLVVLGISVMAFHALAQSKIESKSKGGCGLMLLSFFGPVTALAFAFSVNGWYLIMYAIPAMVIGLILLVVGIVIYTQSQK